EQVEFAGEAGRKFGGEEGVQGGVAFDGEDLGAGLQQGGGERAEAGADLDHAVAGGHAGEFERLAHDVAIDQKILPEKAFGLMPESGEQIAGGGGRERHEWRQSSTAGAGHVNRRSLFPGVFLVLALLSLSAFSFSRIAGGARIVGAKGNKEKEKEEREGWGSVGRSEEHTSELQSRENLECRL